jgi:hypothetical protein
MLIVKVTGLGQGISIFDFRICDFAAFINYPYTQFDNPMEPSPFCIVSFSLTQGYKVFILPWKF